MPWLQAAVVWVIQFVKLSIICRCGAVGGSAVNGRPHCGEAFDVLERCGNWLLRGSLTIRKDRIDTPCAKELLKVMLPMNFDKPGTFQHLQKTP
jgi:hypothetical protein